MVCRPSFHIFKEEYGKCSKITNTKKIINFSAVRNFRNYISEKVLAFVILECGLSLRKPKAFACFPSAEMPTSASSLYRNTVTQGHHVGQIFLQRYT